MFLIINKNIQRPLIKSILIPKIFVYRLALTHLLFWSVAHMILLIFFLSQPSSSQNQVFILFEYLSLIIMNLYRQSESYREAINKQHRKRKVFWK